MRSVLAIVVLALAATPAAAQESPWPVGDIVFGVDENFSDPCAPLHDYTGSGWTLWIGAYIDHAQIGYESLNDPPSLSGWRATIEYFDQSLVAADLYPLGSGAIDLNDDPKVFDVRLEAPIVVDGKTIQPLVRLTFEGPLEGGVVVLGPGGHGTVPTWDSQATSDDCPLPCTRPFRTRSLMSAYWYGAWEACAPDANCGVLIERPLAGATWQAGTVQRVLYSKITWPWSAVRARTIAGWSEISTDGGQTWRAQAGFADALPGWFDWQIPEDLTGEVLLRIHDECPYGEPDAVRFTVLEKVAGDVRSWGSVKARY